MQKRRLIVTILLSLVLITSLLLSACVPKSSSSSSSSSTATSSVVDTTEARLSAVESSINRLSQQTSNSEVTLDQYNTALNRISALESQIITLQEDIEELVANIETTEEEEIEEVEDIDPEDAVEAEVKYSRTTDAEPTAAVFYTSGDNIGKIKTIGYEDCYTDIRIKLENTTEYDLEDIELSLEIELDVDNIEWADGNSYPSSYIDVDLTGISGDLEFSGNNGNYENWDDISLAAGEKESYTIRIKFRVENSVESTEIENTGVKAEVEVGFSIRAECEDFEVVD